MTRDDDVSETYPPAYREKWVDRFDPSETDPPATLPGLAHRSD